MRSLTLLYYTEWVWELAGFKSVLMKQDHNKETGLESTWIKTAEHENMEFIKHLAWRTERKWGAQTGAHANAKNKSWAKTLETDPILQIRGAFDS